MPSMFEWGIRLSARYDTCWAHGIHITLNQKSNPVHFTVQHSARSTARIRYRRCVNLHGQSHVCPSVPGARADIKIQEEKWNRTRRMVPIQVCGSFVIRQYLWPISAINTLKPLFQSLKIPIYAMPLPTLQLRLNRHTAKRSELFFAFLCRFILVGAVYVHALQSIHPYRLHIHIVKKYVSAITSTIPNRCPKSFNMYITFSLAGIRGNTQQTNGRHIIESISPKVIILSNRNPVEKSNLNCPINLIRKQKNYIENNFNHTHTHRGHSAARSEYVNNKINFCPNKPQEQITKCRHAVDRN